MILEQVFTIDKKVNETAEQSKLLLMRESRLQNGLLEQDILEWKYNQPMFMEMLVGPSMKSIMIH